jgi:hypothetical protein
MATTRVLKTISIHAQDGKDGVVIARGLGEAASSTWKAGAPLIYSSGYVAILGSSGAETTAIIGFAAQDATGVTGAAVPIYEANDYNLFEGSLINSSTAYVSVVGNIGADYALVQSTNDWYIDISDTTTNTKVEPVKFIDAIGDTNARVVFRVLGGKQANVLQS